MNIVPQIIQELHQLKDEDYFFDLMSKSNTSLYPFIGVPYHTVKKVAKRIKTQYNLATDFWKQPYYESKQLSFLITNAKVVSEQQIDEQVNELHDDFLIDKFLIYVVVPSNFAIKKVNEWMTSNTVKNKKMGYLLLSEMVKVDVYDTLNYRNCLAVIRNSILNEGDEVKLAMNQALISIGTHKDEYHVECLTISQKIGKLKSTTTKKALKCLDAFTMLKSAKTRAKFSVEF